MIVRHNLSCIPANAHPPSTDAISENNPRIIDDSRARKLATDLKRCSYYETCATYGLNVDRVFHDGTYTPPLAVARIPSCGL